MKFLCRNCKAKYQIADEKVAGRTLRMTCQQCGEAIAVRGPGRAAAAVSRPISQPLAPVALGAQALGADFQRQVALPPEPPSMHGESEWHVAINDVPVGPMRREEVARKIAMGSVNRDALAWREGMDDWMPAKHIPELAILFPPATAPHLPPPPAAMRSMHAPPPPVQPAARAEMAPIGGRQMLSLDDYAPPSQRPMEVVSPTMTIQSIPAEAPSSAGKPLGWAQMFALVSGGALIMMLGAVLGVRVLAPNQSQQQQVVHQVAAGAAAPEPTRAAKPTEQDSQGNMIELDLQDIEGQLANGKPRAAGTTPQPAPTDKGKTGKQLTDEQKAMLARMGGGLEQGPNLRAPTEKPSGSSGGGGGQLTAEQLSKVVLQGRKNLQRCYETALRGANSDETVRLDVEIEVSPNGNVTSVHTGGKGLPGMEECITRTVRMWRFPSSGDTTQTRFPVVFQPGG